MRRSHNLFLSAAFIVSLLLASCANDHNAQSTKLPLRRLWLVLDPAALVTKLNPALPSQAPSAPKPSLLETWQNPATQWMAIERDMVAREWVSPPRAARYYALLAVGINDALLVADVARAKGMDVSDDAIVATVAEQIMSYSHPLLAELFQQQANEARWVGVWRGDATPTGVAAGQQLGQLVAEHVLAWARSDGAEEFSNFSHPIPSPGVWQRTPPRLWSALDPGWGRVRPIAIPSAASMAAVTPPTWDSAEFQAEREAFVQIQHSLTDADHALAKKWAAKMGTMTPAGMWLEIASNLIEREKLDVRQSAVIYATLGVAMHDSFIACWYSKFSYLVVRPITWMQERDQSWTSYIETPPFPSYPSGHSTVSGAASTVLSAYFPQDQQQLAKWANDASYSRVVGGIHWSLDGKAGLEEGQSIGSWVLTHVPVGQQTAIKP